MRLYVGTLYSNENEFEECLRSIETQNYRNFKHYIFKSLPKKKALDTLYSSFLENSDQYDLLIKVDSDMVLANRDFFGKVVDKFNTHPWLEHLEVAVYDFFSDQLIWGLNSYRNTFKWKKSSENLFTDLVPTDSKHKFRDKEDLAPASIHCKNPSPFQSFHYGVHKAMKVMQPDREQKKPHYTLYHWDIIQKTWNHFKRAKDVRLGLAVLGAELAFYEKLQPVHLDYTNPYCRNLFLKYADYDHHQIYHEVKRIRKLAWGFLKNDLRRDALCYLEGGHILQAAAWPRLFKGFLRYLQLKTAGQEN